MYLDRTEKDGIISCLFKSSNILASEYNQEKKELTITFNAGRRYTYSNVEHKDYVRFEIAESQGQIFNKHIKKYTTVKNPDVNPTELLNKVTQIINEQAGHTVSKSS
jgi:hypothetical protein